MASINGTYGDDVLTADGDIVHGLFGYDTITGGVLVDTLYGDQQDDTLSGLGGADVLHGGSGNDSLIGGADADRLHGGEGDDWLDLGVFSEMNGDTANGGSGVDTLGADFSARSTPIVFVAPDPLLTVTIAGRFTVTGVERFYLTATAFNDQLTGYLLADVLQGGRGADILDGSYGGDELSGGIGTDTLRGGGGSDVIDGGDNADTLQGQGGRDDLRGGQGDDQLYGGDSDDLLAGNADADRIDGGNGKDILYGEGGADTLIGGAGNDVLSTHSGSSVSGDTGLDTDAADAGAGNDEVGIGANDIADGGLDFDTITLDFSGAGAGETYALQSGSFTFGNGARIQAFEQLVFLGGSGVDTITGGGFADQLTGGKGSDVLNGGAGGDELAGDSLQNLTSGAGNDVLRGGGGGDTLHDDAGADKLYGQDGNDRLFCAAWSADRSAADVFDGGIGRDTVAFHAGDIPVVLDLAAQGNNDGRAKNDTFVGIEVFEGTWSDDILKGNALANTFSGGANDDVLDGRGGADVLNGEASSDTMTGGSGADRFQFLDFDPGWRGDRITDFQRGVDKLQVDVGNFFGSSAFKFQQATSPLATSAGPVFLFETDTARLWFDEDGNDQDLGPVLIATLDGVTALATSDFDLIA